MEAHAGEKTETWAFPNRGHRAGEPCLFAEKRAQTRNEPHSGLRDPDKDSCLLRYSSVSEKLLQFRPQVGLGPHWAWAQGSGAPCPEGERGDWT